MPEPSANQSPSYLRPKDLIRELQIPKTTLYRAITSGGIQCVRLTPRGAIRIPISELERLRQQLLILQQEG